MTLAASTELGPYEILSPLGAGGMGEVYRARDTQLGREVAIKLVGEALAKDPEHMARFEREARLLASLNHPNIAAIYGIEQREGVRFLVLELIEGQSLDERLAAGPLPMREALDLSRQIADALHAAHEKGVVHRDLKPANVRVTPEGRAKVLDFGLAKSIEASGPDSSTAATEAAGRTAAGTILGTPSYMSPEQARGRTVDKRTDMWSFGCVLYETLVGRRAFGGETTSDCLAAIIHRDPDWDALPRQTPASVRRLLHRCLEKDPEHRLRDAADARLEIEEALAALEGPRGRRSLPTAAVLAVAVAALAILALVLGRRAGPAGAPSPKLTQITLAGGLEESPSWAPDGATIAYTAQVGAVRKVMTRRLGAGEGVPLTAGASDDIQPAWSPDGKTIAFVRAREEGKKLEPADVFGQYSGADVWSVNVATRKESRLIENAFNPSFSPDGKRIAVDASWAGPRRIWITDASGLNPQQVSTDVSEAVDHVRPRWSADGKRIVFQNIERTKFDVRLVDLASKELVWITHDLFQNIQPVASPSGRFLYFTSNRAGGWNLWRAEIGSDGKPLGAPQQLTTGAGQDVEPAISRDGRRLAFAILRQNADLWKLPVDPASGEPTGPPEEVVATTREDSRGAWSPDGRTIAFNSDRSGDTNLWLYSLDTKTTRQLTTGPGGDYQPNWSPDGKTIVFFSSRSGNAGLWMVDVASGALRRATKSPTIDINPAFSPDGKWVAFQSDRSGRLEVWLLGADRSGPAQLTRVGVAGHFLLWSRDSRSIVFRCPCGGKPQSMRVTLDGRDPEPLAEVTGGSHMSFSPDATRIMDVLSHKTLWVSPLEGGKPEKVFAFDDPDSRIDYPVWSPDGKWVLFDRFRPQGGDIWMMEGFE